MAKRPRRRTTPTPAVEPAQPVNRSRVARWLLAAYLLVLTSFYLDISVTPNSTSRILATLSLLMTGSFAIDQFADYTEDKSLVGGHYYSDKAPLPSVLFTVPEWLLEKNWPARSEKVRFDRALALGGWLFASVPLAIFGLWLLGDGLSLAATIVILCGTFLWIFAGTFFGHAFAGFLLVLAHRYAFRWKRPVMAGCLLGAAFLTEFPTALGLPAFLLAMFGDTQAGSDWRHRLRATIGPALRLTAGFVAVAMWILPYNAAITGDPWTMVYTYVAEPAFAPMRTNLGFRFSSMAEGLWGLLFSPARGLFVFAPIGLVVFASGRRWFRALRRHTRMPGSATYFAASLLLFSSYYLWSGGGSYGPRHLIPAFMLAVAELAPVVARDERDARPWVWRTVIVSAAIVGILPALADKLTLQYVLPDWYHEPLTELVFPAFWAGQWNAHAIPSMLWGWEPQSSLALFSMLAAVGAVSLRRLSRRFREG